MIPLIGFLPADDPRMRRNGGGDRAGARTRRIRATATSTTRKAEASTVSRPAKARSCPARSGSWTTSRSRGGIDEADALFQRLLALRNDVGLLAEEYDPEAKRQLGNFPQAFTHVALVNTAFNLDRQEQRSTMEQRAPHDDPTAY